jgi:hypothetical protein
LYDAAADPSAVLPEHDLVSQYVKHQLGEDRQVEDAGMDIGAYEFSRDITCSGDANGDGDIDPLDAGYIQARFNCGVFQGDPECDAADVNRDEVVDPLDTGYVLARFGPCP